MHYTKEKNEKQDMVRMRCNCGIENGHKVNINDGHGLPNDAPYSWLWVKPKSNKEEKLRDKHKKWNGKMEGKWNEKTYDGGWEMSCHLECDVLQDECVGRHLRDSQSLKIRPQT